MTCTLIDLGAWPNPDKNIDRDIQRILERDHWRRMPTDTGTDLIRYRHGRIRLQVSPFGYLLVDTDDPETIRRLTGRLEGLWSNAKGLSYPMTETADRFDDDRIPVVLMDHALRQLRDWIRMGTLQGSDRWCETLIIRCERVERLHPGADDETWETDSQRLRKDSELISRDARILSEDSSLPPTLAFTALLLSPISTLLVSLDSGWGPMRIAGAVCALSAAFLTGMAEWVRRHTR